MLECPDCGQVRLDSSLENPCPLCSLTLALEAILDPATRDRLPDEYPERYEELREHGRGGMGRVLQVHDRLMGRQVALKELHIGDSAARRDEWSRRFLREARVISRLEHPAIVPIHEIGVRLNGRPYYTMRFVEGQTLGVELGAATTLQARLAYLPHFVDLCQAIAFAHSHGVIHRDIKPANIVIGSYGQTAVIDWGLAKTMGTPESDEPRVLPDAPDVHAGDDNERYVTRAGTTLGTPGFMAPEQARGDLDHVDEQSDIYALGAILYVILTGRVPHDGPSPLAIVQKTLEQTPTPIRALAPEAPKELIAICARAMNKEKHFRYARVNDLIDEIARFQSGALVIAHEYTFSELARRFLRKHRKALLVSLTILATLLGLAAFSYTSILRSRNRERDARILAEQAQFYSSIRLCGAYLRERRFDTVREMLDAISPEDRNIEWGLLHRQASARRWESEISPSIFFFRCQMSPSGEWVIAAGESGVLAKRRTSDGELVMNVHAHEAEITKATFTADGEAIVTAARDNTAKRWDSKSGVLLQTYPHTDELMDVACSPDNLHFATVCSDGTARIWSLEGDTEPQTIDCGDEKLHRLAYSPDGRYLILGSKSKSVLLWDTKTNDVKPLPGHTDFIQNVTFSFDGSLAASTSRDGTARLWKMPEGELAHVLDGHSGPINHGLFGPDGAWFVTASADDSARVWNTATGQNISTFRRHEFSVENVGIVPGTGMVLTSGMDSVIWMWDPMTGLPVNRFTGARNWITDFCVSPDGSMIVASDLTRAHGWRTDRGEFSAAYRGLGRIPRKLFYRPDGTELVSIPDFESEKPSKTDVVWSENPTGIVWDTVARKKVRDLPRLDTRVVAGGYIEGKLRLVTADAKLWDGAAGDLLATLKEVPADILDAVFCDGGTRVALLCRHDPKLYICSTSSGERLLVLDNHEAPASCMAVNASGTRLATSDWSTRRCLWDVRTGALLQTFTGEGTTMCIAISPDDQQVISGGGSNNITVFDVASGKLVHTLKGHISPLYGLAYTPDGSRIVSGGTWDFLRMWDPDTGEELMHTNSPDDNLRSMALSPDGMTIATGHETGSVFELHADDWR